MNASNIKMLLKIRWPFQESKEIIPPQLQGSSLLKAMIAPMYMVKAIIKASEAYKPARRQRGMISRKETINSVSGNDQAINEETGCNMGDSAICSLNTEYSISLLMPVYKKSITKSIETISTMVAFESQENEMIFANTFRFWITGPSIVKMVDNG